MGDARVRKERPTAAAWTRREILPEESPEFQRSVSPWENETTSLPNDVEKVDDPVEHMDDEGGGRRRGGGAAAGRVSCGGS